MQIAKIWLSELEQEEIKFSLFLHIGENCLNEACTEASERAGAVRARACAFIVGVLGAKQEKRSFVGK